MNPNHAIIEGPDGSGKSRLIETLGLARVHTLAFKPEFGHPVTFYNQRIRGALKPTGFDRLWLSEMIYGPILRGKSAVSEEHAWLLKRTFPDVPVIVCLPPWPITLNATRSRPWPDYQTDDFLRQSYDAFQKFADTDLVDYVFDWTTNTLRRSLGVPMVRRPLVSR